MIDDIKNIKSGIKELREFGLTIGIFFVIVTLIAFIVFKKPLNVTLLIVAFIFIILGLACPKLLKPLQKVWMSIAIVIGFFMSRVILSVLFYFVLTPIGLVMRIFGKDVLDQKIDKNKSSYWHTITDDLKKPESYENQF